MHNFSLFGKLIAQPGKGAELCNILLKAAEQVAQLPGCRQYLVFQDLADADKICVAEIWENREAHAASLQIPEVLALIQSARPIIAGFSDRTEMRWEGGHGLAHP